MMSVTSVGTWLCELRHSVESYEQGVRPPSTASELAAIFEKKMAALQQETRPREKKLQRPDEGGDGTGGLLEVKHADVCRVSVVFQDCVEAAVQDDVVEPVTVDNFEVYVTKDVLCWLSNLWYSSEEEDDDFEEFTSALENYQERNAARTPRFPVDGQDGAAELDVELRSSDRRRSPRSQTLHIMSEVSQGVQLGGQRSDTKDVIEIRSPKWTYDGHTREKVPLIQIHDGQLTVIKDNSLPEVIATELVVSKKSPKRIELTDCDRKVYIIKSDSIRDVKQNETVVSTTTRRHRANSLTEKPVEKKKNILQKLLKRRSNRDLLERKGILMNEEIFGNTLTKLYEKSRNVVPVFVRNAIALIETERNIRSEYIYRIPGNLAIIQKIRVNVDRNNLKILDEYRNDPDVLSGALKMFFRELKEPLVPYRSYDQLQRILERPSDAGTGKAVRGVIQKIESPHRETLEVLIDHLLMVVAHSDDNRMNVNSLSIVWGPSLLWRPDSTKDNAFGFSVNVNRVIELILNSYRNPNEPTGGATARNDVRQRKASGEREQLVSIGEEEEERVKSSPKMGGSRLRELSTQLIGFMRADSRQDKTFGGSNLSLASSYDNEAEPRTPIKKERSCHNLEALPKRENTNVPELIWKLTAQIEKHASAENLYTEAGDKEKVSKLMKKAKPDLQKADVHNLTDWLKKLVQELEEPLIPCHVFEDFVRDYDNLSEIQKRRHVADSVANLRPAQRETIEHLANHILRVLAAQRDRKKLTAETISIIWAPVFHPTLKIDESNKGDLEKYLDFVVTLLAVYENVGKRKEDDCLTTTNVSAETGNKNFKHNFKFKSKGGGAVIGMTYSKRNGDEVRIKYEGREKFDGKEIIETEKNTPTTASTASTSSGKITMGMISEKLRSVTKYETSTLKKNEVKKPLSYYENVPAEVYKEVDRYEL